MKSAEEIIQGLECCLGDIDACRECPYKGGNILICIQQLKTDALELIRQLRAQNETQADTIKQLIAAFGDQLPRPRRKEEAKP